MLGLVSRIGCAGLARAGAAVFECSSSFSGRCCIADGVMDERSFGRESILSPGFFIGA